MCVCVCVCVTHSYLRVFIEPFLYVFILVFSAKLLYKTPFPVKCLFKIQWFDLVSLIQNVVSNSWSSLIFTSLDQLVWPLQALQWSAKMHQGTFFLFFLLSDVNSFWNFWRVRCMYSVVCMLAWCPWLNTYSCQEKREETVYKSLAKWREWFSILTTITHGNSFCWLWSLY